MKYARQEGIPKPSDKPKRVLMIIIDSKQPGNRINRNDVIQPKIIHEERNLFLFVLFEKFEPNIPEIMIELQ